MNKILLGVMVACGLYSTYNLAIIAGNTTKETVTASLMTDALSAMSPAISGARAAGWISNGSPLEKADSQAKHNAKLAAEGRLTAAEARLEEAENNPQQHAQAAHRDRYKTSCADLAKFVKAGVELTPPQEQQLANCHLTARVNVMPKQRTVKGHGRTVKIQGDQVYVDGHAAALDETTDSAKVFSSGLDQIIVYKTGRVTLLTNKVFVGDLK